GFREVAHLELDAGERERERGGQVGGLRDRGLVRARGVAITAEPAERGRALRERVDEAGVLLEDGVEGAHRLFVLALLDEPEGGARARVARDPVARVGQRRPGLRKRSTAGEVAEARQLLALLLRGGSGGAEVGREARERRAHRDRGLRLLGEDVLPLGRIALE